MDSNGLLEVCAPFPAVLQGQRPDKNTRQSIDKLLFKTYQLQHSKELREEDVCAAITSYDFGVSRFWKLASQLETKTTNKQTNNQLTNQGDDTFKQVETRKYPLWMTHQ